MKIWSNFSKAAGKIMLLAAMVCPMFTSCYDDSDLRGQLAGLANKVQALEQRLNSEVATLKALIDAVDAKTTVAEVKEVNGEYTITLSDGKKFTVYPQAHEQISSIVTIATVEGVAYWAVVGEDGKATPVLDKDGNKIPVEKVEPQIKTDEETGLVSISFDGGKTWQVTGEMNNNPAIFESVEVVYSELTEDEIEAGFEPEAMYVQFTLPTGEVLTLTVDGFGSIAFGNPYMGMVKEMFIPAGTVYEQQTAVNGVTEVVYSGPEGWLIEETSNGYGETFIKITAPEQAYIDAKMAQASGYIKAIGVCEGGKTITAKLFVTTSAFSKIGYVKGNVVINPTYGLGKYYYGVVPAADFDAEEVFNTILDEIDNYYGATYEWENSGIELAVEDVVENPVYGEEYVVFAVPAYYNMEWGEYYLQEGTLVSSSFIYHSVEIETTKVSFNDIQITADFKGVEYFMGDFTDKEYFEVGPVLYQLNESLKYGYAPVVEYAYEEPYKGNPVDFVEGYGNIDPNSEYVFWVIVYDPNKTEYTEEDMYIFEYTTDGLVAGGSATVTAGEATATYTQVKVPLTASAEDAAYIYYAFVEAEMLPTISDKGAYLLESGVRAIGSTTTAVENGLKPNTSTTLLAMAIDKDGAYGEVFEKEYKTPEVTYSDVKVTAAVEGKAGATTTIKVTVDKAVERLEYFCDLDDSYFWTNTLGGTVESAQEYMATATSRYVFTKVQAAQIVDNTCTITLEDLEMGTYNFVVTAVTKDENGNLVYSKIGHVEFEYTIDLGNFVFATDENGQANAAWAAAKPTVTYNVEQVGDFNPTTWTVTLPEGFTGVTCCIHEEYFTSYSAAKDKVKYILTSPYLGTQEIVAGETYTQEYASNGYNIYVVIKDAQGNYYETYEWKLDIQGGFGQ